MKWKCMLPYWTESSTVLMTYREIFQILAGIWFEIMQKDKKDANLKKLIADGMSGKIYTCLRNCNMVILLIVGEGKKLYIFQRMHHFICRKVTRKDVQKSLPRKLKPFINDNDFRKQKVVRLLT